MVTSNFDSGSEDDFDVICNIVSVLPRECDCIIEVTELVDCGEEEKAKHKPMCNFMMNNGCIEEKNAFFERPGEGMKSHLKPLFIRDKVDNTIVNKILVYGGIAFNLMPHFLLRKIGKYDTDMRPHNMVLSNYEANTGHTMGVIHVNVIVGSITRPIIFIVITSKESYNLILGREWIHDIGVVPSSLYQRVEIWRNYGIVYKLESDQGYFIEEVNHVDIRNFD